MQARRVRERLRHMLDAAHAIERLTAGKTLADYSADPDLATAVRTGPAIFRSSNRAASECGLSLRTPWLRSSGQGGRAWPRGRYGGAMKRPAVYIMANRRNGTLYTGVTSNLTRRVYQHRESVTPGFASRYGCRMLVYYEAHDDMQSAIAREKKIKAGSRWKKLALIEERNPDWRDLYEDLV